jgi:hypothetical protein
MSPYDVASFEDFWPHYVRLHTRPSTQWGHALATATCLALLGGGVALRSPLLAALGPLADYAIAQLSHRAFEGNRTTPWKRQTWHTRAELRMFRLVVTGGMRAETARCA